MLFHYSCISQQLPAVLWVVWRDPKDKDKNLFGILFLRWTKKTKEEANKHSDTFTLTHTHILYSYSTVDLMENFSVLFFFYFFCKFKFHCSKFLKVCVIELDVFCQK